MTPWVPFTFLGLWVGHLSAPLSSPALTACPPALPGALGASGLTSWCWVAFALQAICWRSTPVKDRGKSQIGREEADLWHTPTVPWQGPRGGLELTHVPQFSHTWSKWQDHSTPTWVGHCICCSGRVFLGEAPLWSPGRPWGSWQLGWQVLPKCGVWAAHLCVHQRAQALLLTWALVPQTCCHLLFPRQTPPLRLPDCCLGSWTPALQPAPLAPCNKALRLVTPACCLAQKNRMPLLPAIGREDETDTLKGTRAIHTLQLPLCFAQMPPVERACLIATSCHSNILLDAFSSYYLDLHLANIFLSFPLNVTLLKANISTLAA